MQTLQDLINEGGAGPFESRIEVREGVAWFRCRCGRRVRAEMMLDLLPPDAPGLTDGPQGADRFRCDGCWRKWEMSGAVDRAVLRAATGQPPLE